MCQMHLTDSFSTKFGFKNVPKLQNRMNISKDPICLCQIHPSSLSQGPQGVWPTRFANKHWEIPGFHFGCPGFASQHQDSWGDMGGIPVVHGGLYRRFIPQTYVPSIFPGDQPMCQFLRPQRRLRPTRFPPVVKRGVFQGESYITSSVYICTKSEKNPCHINKHSLRV